MNIYRSLSELPPLPRPVVTIGTFDGVHLGHQRLIGQLRQLAGEVGGTGLLVTFDPHPRQVIQPDQALHLLSTLPEKLGLLAHFGTDAVLVMPFTREFSEISAEAYVEQFLFKSIRPHTVVIGYDHRFGRDRSGGIELLRERGPQHGVRILEIDPREIDDAAISSTRIRKALGEGRVEDARHLLGLPYSLSGIVVRGEQIGRQLGYPTANLRIDHPVKLIPGDGIYAVIAEWRGQRIGGMLSIGFRPTFNGQNRSIEVNLFGFSGDLYGETLRLHFLRHLRSEQRFSSRETLVAAMDGDKANSLRVLEEAGDLSRLELAPWGMPA
jgi:riboflavin kinase / FMN adenylyltransferase